MELQVDKVYKISYILKGEIHLYVCLISMLIEETRTDFSFFKCILEKQKQLKSN